MFSLPCAASLHRPEINRFFGIVIRMIIVPPTRPRRDLNPQRSVFDEPRRDSQPTRPCPITDQQSNRPIGRRGVGPTVRPPLGPCPSPLLHVQTG